MKCKCGSVKLTKIITRQFDEILQIIDGETHTYGFTENEDPMSNNNIIKSEIFCNRCGVLVREDK